MTIAGYWLIDIHINGAWRPSSVAGYERTLQAARNRADAVSHWCPARVRNSVDGETWERKAGGAWSKVDPTAPVQASAAPPANPRRPLAHPAHAVAPAVDPVDGVPEEQLQWWQK